MSRLLGRSYDAYTVSKELKEAKIRKYKPDNTVTTWKSVENSPEKYEMYLPESAIDFLKSKKIKIYRTPFLIYTDMQIPTMEDQERYIRFPSKIPIERFKTELAYFIGMLLADYRGDDEENLYSFPKEYSDLLPNLLVYFQLKEEGKEEDFLKRHLGILAQYVGTFITDYEAFKDFDEFQKGVNTIFMEPEKYEKFTDLIKENEEKIASATGETLIQLSALDGALQIIDRCESKEDFQKYVEMLFLNPNHDRSSLLRENGIQSYGYKRLRKAIEDYKRK